MAKYIFSQGKIRVENGVYVHRRGSNIGSRESVVLILVQPTPPAQNEPESTQDKDTDNDETR